MINPEYELIKKKLYRTYIEWNLDLSKTQKDWRKPQKKNKIQKI